MRRVSILYKYHISQEVTFDDGTVLTMVSILYKYHISLSGSHAYGLDTPEVSILYKYHISLTKYSTFLALVDKIIEK